MFAYCSVFMTVKVMRTENLLRAQYSDSSFEDFACGFMTYCEFALKIVTNVGHGKGPEHLGMLVM
jgi:hypothetical protein